MNSETCWWLVRNYCSEEIDKKLEGLVTGWSVSSPRWFRSKCFPKPRQVWSEPRITLLCTALPCYEKCRNNKCQVMIQKCFVKQPVHEPYGTKESSEIATGFMFYFFLKLHTHVIIWLELLTDKSWFTILPDFFIFSVLKECIQRMLHQSIFCCLKISVSEQLDAFWRNVLSQHFTKICQSVSIIVNNNTIIMTSLGQDLRAFQYIQSIMWNVHLRRQQYRDMHILLTRHTFTSLNILYIHKLMNFNQNW
jgi:hypothetical protein